MSTSNGQVADTLANLGFSLTSQTVDAGGLNRESCFTVTLTRNGQSLTTSYRKGSAYRVWEHNHRNRLAGSIWASRYKPGERVPFVGKRYYDDSEPAKLFDAATSPVTPTLEEVVQSLIMDASFVRHGQSFDDFCAELGYDEDSRKAEQSFAGCTEIWRGLVRLGVDFDQLEAIFQDF